jgi:hypothetical protein
MMRPTEVQGAMTVHAGGGAGETGVIRVQDSPTLQQKYFGFLRSKQVLQDEIDSWITAADGLESETLTTAGPKKLLGRNFRQLQRLRDSLTDMFEQSAPLVDGLSLSSPRDEFLSKSSQAAGRWQVIAYVWDYFRDKLELRLLPQFRDALWAADLIVNDCYRTPMDRAGQLGIALIAKDNEVTVTAKREAPLLFLDARRGTPATHRRHVVDEQNFGQYDFQGFQKRNRQLPLALIELPSASVQSFWDFVGLAHEVAHDLDGDLNTLHDDLPLSVTKALSSVDDSRRARWTKWTLEVFADLMALRLLGPAYARWSCQTLSSEHVLSIDMPGYPSAFLRVALMAHYLDKQLGLPDEAETVMVRWAQVFGQMPTDQMAYASDFDAVIAALFATPLPSLSAGKKAHSAAELVTFTGDDQTDIKTTTIVLKYITNELRVDKSGPAELRRRAREKFGKFFIRETLLPGGGRHQIGIAGPAPHVPPRIRHIASAAYFAFEELAAETPPSEMGRTNDVLNLVAQELVKTKQPSVTLDGPAEGDKAYIRAQTRRLFETLMPVLNPIGGNDG